jgi:hypothetical protein
MQRKASHITRCISELFIQITGGQSLQGEYFAYKDVGKGRGRYGLLPSCGIRASMHITGFCSCKTGIHAILGNKVNI